MNLKIKDIIRCTNGILVTGNEEYECENFSRDTRIIKKGDTFVAIKGENFDGNDYWKEAFDNGAETVIINKIVISNEEKEKYKNKNIIQVDDTINALQQIAIEKRIIKICKIVSVIEDILIEEFVSFAESISERIKSCMMSEKSAEIVRISSSEVSFAVTVLPCFICASSISMLRSRVVQAR